MTETISDTPKNDKEKQEEALSKQINEFWEDLNALIEKHAITQHVFLVVHPAAPAPLIHFNPDEYTAAKLAKVALGQLRELVNESLSN